MKSRWGLGTGVCSQSRGSRAGLHPSRCAGCPGRGNPCLACWACWTAGCSSGRPCSVASALGFALSLPSCRSFNRLANCRIENHAVKMACSVNSGAEHVQGGPPGVLDETLPRILGLLDSQLFGGVAEEKDVAAVAAGSREAKRARGASTFGLLVQGTTLRLHLADVLSLVRCCCLTCWISAGLARSGRELAVWACWLNIVLPMHLAGVIKQPS